LVERQDELGGHLNLVSRLPHQDGWGVAVDNLTRALRVAGVKVETGRNADAEFVREFGADHVLLAVGAHYDPHGVSVWRPDLETLPGSDAPNVLPIDQACSRALAEGGTVFGPHVVIVDESGTVLPFGLAEILAEAGTQVEIVTPHLFVGSEVYAHLRMPWLTPRLKEAGVKFHAQRRIDG